MWLGDRTGGGSLDQLLLSGLSPPAAAAGKAAAHWLLTGLPPLVLPLATPVLIFGTAVVAADHPRGELPLLAALLAAALPLCPLAAGAWLRAAAGS